MAEGVDSAMLASIAQANSSKNNRNTGASVATSADTLGGDLNKNLHAISANVSNTFSSLGGVSLPINSAPFNENILKHAIEGNTSFFNLPGQVLPDANFVGNTGADNLGLAKQTNANIPKLHSGVGGAGAGH